MKLKELEILTRLLPELEADEALRVGPGDDCAVLRTAGDEDLLLTVDQLIEHVHYPAGTPPEDAGAKLMKRNVSDIAAMGGYPRWALLALSAGGRSSNWALAFCRGAAAAGKALGIAIAGGDLAALPTAGSVASLTLIGTVPAGKAVLRSGARPGDYLYVTGEIGNSFASGHHLRFTPRVAEGAFLREAGATAMLDISDGLLLDAKRMAAASQVDFVIDENAVPLRAGATLPEALGDGEDYELLFTLPPGRGPVSWSGPAPATRIGRAVEGSGRLFGINQEEFKGAGYEH